ncbi:hypothetical protein [Celeribacter sp. PS-C1]|uniref:hypothetical protein n=1 Tax=Celeribacter sp. PS-C1 TaxID=2820813 RepID=UPI001CA5F220|nr:hypothetical protein [Celeribacter sp. PS-C1]MBW6417370.1 hypothetical protein [Celeribacter sp. PS-C1]
MDGIVLWSNPDTQKAVIWCSDHADLVYASGAGAMLGSFQMPEPGTMVSFKTRMENGVRICSHLTPLQRHVAPELAQALRDFAASMIAA